MEKVIRMFDCLSQYFNMICFTCKKTCTVSKYCCRYCFRLYCPLFSLIHRPEPHGNHSCTTFKKLFRVSTHSAPDNSSRLQKVQVLSKIRVLWEVLLCFGVNIFRCFEKSQNLQLYPQKVNLIKADF